MVRAWQWREGKSYLKCRFWVLLVSAGLGAARRSQTGIGLKTEYGAKALGPEHNPAMEVGRAGGESHMALT